ncbi:unnamed protein product [Caenorhabditis sp. 36 PRJEB53466]|nr:unnamed protein product [Caenorhabditis sp. 36 PRJEB53466]
MHLLTLFYLLITLHFCFSASVKIVGKFVCNGNPWVDETVSIYESNYVLPDSLLNQNVTDQNGEFVVNASGDDVYPIRPYVYLPNYCNAEVFLGKEWATYLRIRVPEFYVDRATDEARFFMNLGTIELNGVSTEQMGFQKFTDYIRNFAESRSVKEKVEKKLKMSEM